MTRRRWIADQASGDRAVLLGANAEHLARVLRARVGQEFEISTGGRVRLGRVATVSDDRVEFDLGDDLPLAEIAPVTLLLAVFKFDRMEWAIEKSTELGVAQILPVIARRTEPHLAGAAAKRVERWRRIAHEAAQQARRASPPEIVDPQPLKSALRHVARVSDPSTRVEDPRHTMAADLRIVLTENQRGLTLKQALTGNRKLETGNSLATGDQGLTTALAIGPEGGWTNEELAAFSAAGWTAVSLGNTILRAETAAIAALAITLAELQ